MISKTQARQRVKNIRSGVLATEAEKLSIQITESLCSLNEYKNAKHLLIYKSVNNEVDTDYIIKNALINDKIVALPKVNDKELDFYCIDDESELEFGYMGIPEPVADSKKIINPQNGIIIVPGVAFDKERNRCGYGKGFYDRYLSKHDKLLTIGLAFDFQVFDRIETNELDKKLDIIITESRIIYE